jgi:Atypical PilZ domain, cyclic di-GMP receptor
VNAPAGSLLGDGLIVEDTMSIAWLPGELPEGAALHRLNADNHRLLVAEGSLEEHHSNEVLKDESSALIHELQKIEFKIDVLLRLAADLFNQSRTLPTPHRVRMSAVGLEWFGEAAPAIGSTGILDVYVSRVLPQALKVPARVERDSSEGGERVAQIMFVGLSELIVELIEKLIFRHTHK